MHLQELKSFTDIASSLDVTAGHLRRLLFEEKNNLYFEFEIPKKNGSLRKIYAPNDSLLFIQKRLSAILSSSVKLHDKAYGFINKRSIVDNAQLHIRKNVLLNIDLENFFPSISFGRVRSMFMNYFRLDKNVATTLTNICCHPGGFLPQGSPTSPVISNILCKTLDKDLDRLAKNSFGATYSRYADDITFSTKTSWEEIISSKVTLFQKLNDILFDQTIVLDIASSYNPSIHKYEERLLKKKYYSALQSIGFISKHELDTDLSVLHGDIGEFLMHHLVSNYISDNNSVKYLYPKLVLKSNPKMPAYGNDGTIYVPSKKEIFYLEAKFYTNLTKAINKAVDSLKEHNEVTQENIDHKTELFRNIKTKSNDEIIEITDDVNEKLVLFLICDNIFKEEDVLKCLKKNNGLIELKKSFEVIIFVLPILSKSEFLESFKKQSILRGNQYYVQ